MKIFSFHNLCYQLKVLTFLLLFLLITTLIILPSAFTAESLSLIEDVSNFSAQKFVLDNGLIVIFKPVPFCGLVSIDVRVKAGSMYEGRYSGSGISHLVEHMLFKGTKRYKRGDIEKRIRSVGGVINGATTYDYTSYTITVPKENFDLALEILSDALFNSTMDPVELKREKGVVLKEIQLNNDDPMRYLLGMLWQTVFETHPYRYPVIGLEDLFIKITREDLLRYYKQMYIPNNMILVIVGDVENDEVIERVKEYFNNVERKPLIQPFISHERPQTTKRRLDITRDLEMAYFALGYKSVDARSQDMPALDVLSAVLGSGASSRLNTVVYKKKNLVSSIGAWNYTPLDPGIFVISGVTAPEKLEPALIAIEEEIDNVKEDIRENEVRRAKSIIISDYIYSLQTVSDQARDLATNQVLTGDFGFAKTYLKNINDVTPEDVKRVARYYLTDTSLCLVTLSPLYSKSDTAEKRKFKERDIQKFTLRNGLRILLMEDRRLPVVSMIAVFLGGLRAEKEDIAGISNFTSIMMCKATTSKTEEELSDLVEGMGASLRPFSGNNTFGVKFDILSRDIDKGLEIFKDIILHPSFPDDIFEREKTTILASIKAVDDNIFDMGMKKFRETLYKRHPYRFQTLGTLDSVRRLRLKDLKEFYNRYSIPANTVIAIFGDFDLSTVRDELKKSLSVLGTKPKPIFTTIIEEEQKTIQQDVIEINSKQESLIIMGFRGARLNSRDRYVLQLISAAMSGVSGRLSARLRERLGAAYAIGAFSVPALDPGYFVLYALTNRRYIEEVKKEFLRQIISLNKEGLTRQQLDSVKKELIGKHRIALQGNASLAYQSALDELYGLGYNHYQEYKDIINSITNEDIINVSRRYLKPDAFTLVVIKGTRCD